MVAHKKVFSLSQIYTNINWAHLQKKIRYLWVIIGITVIFPALKAQETPRIRNFSPVEYGAQNQNWSLAQHPDGWILAGNNAGMLEFDGSNWDIYDLPEKQTVRSVATGEDGKIFCGGYGEFGFWERNERGQLIYNSLSKGVQSDNLAKEEIWHILVQPGFVIFQSFSVFYKYDYHSVTVLKPPASIMYVQSVNEGLYFQVIGQGLYELLPNNTFRFLEGSGVLGHSIVQFMVSDEKGGMLVGTSNDGIWVYYQTKMSPWQHPLNAVFKKYQLNKGVRLRDGGWVFGTIINGVYILRKDGSLRAHLNRESGLQNNTVLALLEDDRNNLWIGLDKGIDFVELNSPLTFFNDQSGKVGAVYSAVLWQDNLYLGTNQGVFFKKWNDNQHPFQLIEGTQGQVWQLSVQAGQLLCGHNSGTFIIQNNTAQKISDITGGWCVLPHPNDQKQMLLQSTYTGLVIFTRDHNGQWMFSHRLQGFTEPLKKIDFDRLGNLWGAHPNKGLYRLKLDSAWSKVVEWKKFTAPIQAEKWIECHPNVVFSVNRQEIQMFDRNKINQAERLYRFPLKLITGFENISALLPDKFLFCHENGYAILDLSLLHQLKKYNDSKPVVRHIGMLGSPIVVAAHPSGIKFSADENALVFRFAHPFYTQTPKFTWRMDGFSDEWSPWQTAAYKEFTNLPPGKYIFRLKSDMSDAVEMVAFTIEKPWYLQIWALILYAIALLGLLAWLEKQNQKMFERQRWLLEAEKARELELQRTEAEREILALEVENQSRELSNAALSLVRKNEILQHIKDDLQLANADPKNLQKIIRLIDGHLDGDHDWEIFEQSFNRVHNNFFKRLMSEYPELTPGDLRLAAYLKMNLSSKEIAPLLNISVRGIENKRYRLRKRLYLPDEINLTEFLISY